MAFLAINPKSTLEQAEIKNSVDIGCIGIIDPDKMFICSKSDRLFLQRESQENTDMSIEVYIRLDSLQRCSAIELLKYLRRGNRIWYVQDVNFISSLKMFKDTGAYDMVIWAQNR